MTRIVVLDDDIFFAKMLSAALAQRGLSCTYFLQASDLVDAVAASDPPDIFILDYNLGTTRETGLTVCRKVSLLYDRPVIMLTGDGSVDTLVACLDAGAVQYITKPCDMDELTARIGVVMRTHARQQAVASAQLGGTSDESRLLTFRSLILDPTSREAVWDEGRRLRVTLTEKEFQLVRLFLKSPDRALSRTDAFFALYNYEMEPENRSVDVLVARLRQRLRGIRAGLAIQNLRGVGYRLIPVEGRLELPSAAGGDDAAKTTDPASRPEEIAFAILDRDYLMQMMGSRDPVVLRAVLRTFLQQVGGTFKLLMEMSVDDRQLLREVVERLRGNSASIGAELLSARLQALYVQCQREGVDGEDIHAALDVVRSAWTVTEAMLHRELQLDAS
jgi:DNA-binding response OmpR family regulator